MASGWWVVLAVSAVAAGFAAGWRVRARHVSRHHSSGTTPDGAGRIVEQVMEVSAVAGGLAHEIRNPLSTLKVNLQLLGEDWTDESVPVQDLRRRSLQRLATLSIEANRLHNILDDFLRLIGRQELRLGPRDLNEIVRQFVEFYEPQAAANSVRVRIEAAGVPLVCRVDEDLVKQVLLNLCLNAQEAMPQGGEITIRTSQSGDRWARVEVSDTGPGLAPEVAEHVFEPYFSTKPRGTGLGLALTRRIVRAHEGTIVAASHPGTGTTFAITLPLPNAER